MKINTIQRDITLKQGTFGHSSKLQKEKKSGADIYDRGYNAGYSGSFTGKSKSAATFMDKILDSKWFGSLASSAQKHNVATSALIALGLAGVLRPATTMALPGQKDKEDKIYASGHAISSGVMGFIVSLILTSPLDDAFTKCYEASKKLANVELLESGKTIHDEDILKETQELMKDENAVKLLKERAAQPLKDMFLKLQKLELSKEEFKNLSKEELKNLKADKKFLKLKTSAMSTLMKTMPEWVIAVPRACITIALIPPILKFVFGIEKKKKSEQNIVKENVNMNFIDKPVFAEIKGGIK